MEKCNYDLDSLGWDEVWQASFLEYAERGYKPARVAEHSVALYQLHSTAGITPAQIAGRLRHQAANTCDLPVVGDWVAMTPALGDGRSIIHAVLPRRSKFGRKAPGKNTQEQLIATNIDTVFLVTSLNQDLNLRRLERYLVLAWEGGASPVILLSKSDLCPDPAARLLSVQSVAAGAPIHVVSASEHSGLDSLNRYLRKGQTIALLGSSGVGKSTLINCLARRTVQTTAPIRDHDDRGRHTTTRRQMFVLPSGAIVIDTPGLREIQMLDSPEGLTSTFREIEVLAASCFFNDCAHQGEPGCAVQRALDEGRLEDQRFANYERLCKEMRHSALKQDKRARAENKKKMKKFWRQVDEIMRAKKNR